MNTQMNLVGLVIVTVAVMYLFYKYVKMEREYSNDISKLKQNIQEMSHMIALNNDIKIKRDIDVIPQPEVTPELKEELDITSNEEYSSLKEEYNSYTLNGGKYDSISEDLKREIETLESNEENANSFDEETHFTEQVVDEVDGEVGGDDEVDGEVGGDDELVDDDEVDGEVGGEVGGEVNDSVVLEEPVDLVIESLENELTNNLINDIIASASDVDNDFNLDTSILLDKLDSNYFVEMDSIKRNIEELTIKELKNVSKFYNLKTTGKKGELLDRIKEYNDTSKTGQHFFMNN
jgi:hypothetical protein